MKGRDIRGGIKGNAIWYLQFVAQTLILFLFLSLCPCELRSHKDPASAFTIVGGKQNDTIVRQPIVWKDFEIVPKENQRKSKQQENLRRKRRPLPVK